MHSQLIRPETEHNNGTLKAGSLHLPVDPRLLLLILALAGFTREPIYAQTRIDLRAQSRGMDFAGAVSTKPLKTGTVLPATCSVGEGFFKTDANPGANLHWCVATNQWSAQAPNAVDRTAITDYAAGARQTFRADATNAGMRIVPGDLPAVAGAGDLAIDSNDANHMKIFDGAGWKRLGKIGAGTIQEGDCATFQADGTIVSSQAPCGSGGGATLSAGSGISIASGSTSAISINTATVPTFLTNTRSINFPVIDPASCQESDVTLPGSTTDDAVVVGWPTDLEAGLTGIARVSSAGTVRVRLCNVTAAGIDPLIGLFRVSIVRNF